MNNQQYPNQVPNQYNQVPNSNPIPNGNMNPTPANFKKRITPFTITLFSTILVVFACFLPYLSIKSEYRSMAQSASALVNSHISVADQGEESIGTAGIDISNISIASLSSFSEGSDTALVTLMIVAVLCLTVLSVLFTVRRKPIIVVLCTIIAFIFVMIMHAAFADIGVFSEFSPYRMGIGFPLYIIFSITSVVGAVMMFLNPNKR